MDRSEIGITIVGLLATFLLPWPGGPEHVGLEGSQPVRSVQANACPGDSQKEAMRARSERLITLERAPMRAVAMPAKTTPAVQPMQ